MMSSTEKVSKSYIMKLLVVFAVPIIILLIPTNEIFTSQMRMTVALTYCMLAWAALELTDVFVPAILWPVAMYLTGTCGLTTLYGPFLSTSVMGCVGALLFANVLERIGVLKRLAFYIASKGGGNFLALNLTIFFAGLAVAVVTFSTGCLIIAALCYGVSKALDIMKTRESAILMMTGMIAASTTRMFLYYPLMQGVIIGSIHTVDPVFNFGWFELLIYNWPVVIFCIVYIILMVKSTGKHASDKFSEGSTYFADELKAMGKMTREEKYGIIVTIGVLLWIFTNPIHGLDSMCAFIVGGAALMFPKIGVADTEDLRGLPWGTIIFFASCMAIGGVCVEVGITAWISATIVPILQGKGIVFTLFIILFMGFVLNFAMTPVAMLAGFSGLLYTIALQLGIDPLAFIFTFNHATDMVVLPYEYLTFLLFFAFGTMTTGQFFKYHLAKDILYFIFFGIIMVPYWFLVGLI